MIDPVQGLVGMHVAGQVAAAGGVDHVMRMLQQLGALLRRGAARRGHGDQPLQHAARFDQDQVLGDADFAHAQAAARLLLDQAAGHQAHQRLADGRAAQAGHLDQVAFDDGLVGFELERRDHLFDRIVGGFGRAGFDDGRGLFHGDDDQNPCNSRGRAAPAGKLAARIVNIF